MSKFIKNADFLAKKIVIFYILRRDSRKSRNRTRLPNGILLLFGKIVWFKSYFGSNKGIVVKAPADFPYCFIYIYKGKMAEKRLKMGIKTYINGQNDLKFGHNMYDDKFQQFLKLVKKLCFFGKIIGSF